ncbi:MAG: tripartite tricarboxylate transporter substrate binding protein [Burkholderiaceae bacterium]|nr:tripartite tricarboxylate transporter substrate binding protein [Burkholderiaceae bacterium]
MHTTPEAHIPFRRRSRTAVLWLLSATLVGLAAPAYAQPAFPTHPIRLIIPFAPGGPTDIFARLFADRLAAVSGQQVIPENRTGAGGNIAYAAAAKAAPDGYTLVVGTTGLVTNPLLYKSVPFDGDNDFQPVALLATAPLVLLAPPQAPDTLNGLVAKLKAAREKPTYPSGGNGASTHLAAELFKLRTGVQATHVPYRGSGPAFIDMIAGRHAFMMETIAASKPFVSAGQLRIVAVASDKRNPAAPSVPTFTESGVEGIAAFTWNMVLAPARTPPAVIEALNRMANAALTDAALARRTSEMAIDLIADSTPASATAFLASERRRWAEVIKSSGITIDE